LAFVHKQRVEEAADANILSPFQLLALCKAYLTKGQHNVVGIRT
jgi:hypothetical protein